MRSHEGLTVSSDEELVIWIPTRVLACASSDKELGHFLVETVLRSGIFPGKLPASAAAQQWAGADF